eukprot:COSAG06_NODE_1035_length_10999_cov_25.325229_5_plen_91_part_00
MTCAHALPCIAANSPRFYCAMIMNRTRVLLISPANHCDSTCKGCEHAAPLGPWPTQITREHILEKDTAYVRARGCLRSAISHDGWFVMFA